MNKISSVLLALCLMCTGGLALAMEPMDKGGAMEKDTMSKDAMKKEPMKKDGAMMKAQPKKMEKQGDKMEQGGTYMEPKMEPKK